MNSAGRKSQKPVHGPPLQARVVAANRTVLTTCDDPGAHGNEQGGKAKLNGAGEQGQWAWHGKGGRHTQPAEQCRCRRTKSADDPTGTGLEETASSWPASQQNNSRRRRWPASRRAVQVGGGSTMVPATQEAGSDLPYLSVSLPPIAFACHCTYPLP